MKPPITSKPEMYRLLAAGQLGNTVPQWFSLDDWEADQRSHFPLWGIRSGIAGGDKRMRLNVPTDEVPPLYREWFPNGGGNISPMIDEYLTLRGQLVEGIENASAGDLSLNYVEGEPATMWRQAFERFGKHANGLTAMMLLKRHLWVNDLEDMRILLDEYPGHVIEFTTCYRAVGLMSMRNTVIWEVRKY